MIKIEYDVSSYRHSLTVTGHAGFGDAGQDIVCAGVSAILEALGGYLAYKEDATVTMGEGIAYMLATTSPETNAVFLMALVGLSKIRKGYPQCFC